MKFTNTGETVKYHDELKLGKKLNFSTFSRLFKLEEIIVKKET